MSVFNLDSLFNPSSVAVIGAGTRPGSVGKVLARNLFKAGFEGPIMPVNPKHRAIEGVLSYDSVAALPLTPELAVVATPAESVAPVIAELAERGTKAAVVITAGFGEGEAGGEGAARRAAMLAPARAKGLRIVGPNCVGIMVPAIGLNASFSHLAPLPGELAFITQSGAMVTAILDWAEPRGIGFSKVVSLGDIAEVDFGDMLDYLARDPETHAILLYIEGISHARKFMSAARVAARAKPVIVIKGGREAEGARAAASHTGALAGSDGVYDAAFRRAGMLRVEALEELFDAAETLSKVPPVLGERLAILTNGGGLGVLATDALIAEGGRLASLGEATLAKLDAVLPETWSRGNPVDMIGDAPPERYAAALEALLEAPEADAILVMNCPTAITSSADAATAVVETLRRHKALGRRPVFTTWLGAAAAAAGREIFHQAQLPTHFTPERAVRAFMHLCRYRQNQELLMETPPSVPGGFEVEPDKAAGIIEGALDDRREWLNEAEAKQLLSAYGIPVVETRRVETPADAARAAAEIGFPVALKLVSPQVQHKSDVGGVELQLESAPAVESAAERIAERLARRCPDAQLAGYTVQKMVQTRGAHELILGVGDDTQFGPFILFGAGGTAVEVLRDKAIALPPLNMMLARRLMAETRIFKLLEGYRDRPAAAIDEIALTLVKLSQLVAERPEVVEVDINPLLADERGVDALDARVRLKRVAGAAASRLAIRPYPKELEREIPLRGGGAMFVRPIRPEDEPALIEGFQKLSQEDVRFRFFAPLKRLDHRFAARLTQIDYDREMAFVAADAAAPDRDYWAVVRLMSDPDGRCGEYAIVVRSDLKGRGIGRSLMNLILDYARQRGLHEIWGHVMAENSRMLRLVGDLGFSVRPLSDDPGVMFVRKDLESEDRPAARGQSA